MIPKFIIYIRNIVGGEPKELMIWICKYSVPVLHTDEHLYDCYLVVDYYHQYQAKLNFNFEKVEDLKYTNTASLNSLSMYRDDVSIYCSDTLEEAKCKIMNMLYLQ